jgi:hypothetical protein
MIHINKLIESTEKLIGNALGCPIKLQIIYHGKYDKGKVKEKIVQIQKKAEHLAVDLDLKLDTPTIDAYYFALLFIRKSMPYLSNGIIAESLNKDTSTISKAFRKAEDLLTFDEHFLKNYEKIETELNKDLTIHRV